MRINRSSRPFLFLLAGAAILVATAPSGRAADPFVAGGRSTRTLAIAPADADRATARAAALATALGMPGVRHRSERLDDRFEHRVYDEVVSLDARGREVAISRFDTYGRVIMALVLGWTPGPGRAVGSEAAGARGADIARAAGLAVSGAPRVAASAGAGGWAVSWPRVVDGVPVRGDGVRILLWRDGSFHGLTASERTLAPAPGTTIAADVARASAESTAGRRFGASIGPDLGVISEELAWVAANDTWNPAAPDAPAETLRLAWVVRLEARGQLAERVRLFEYWIDAGDGGVIGGDVVE